MAWNGFTLTVENCVAHLTLSRPEKRNALTRSFLQDLPAAIRELDDSGRARVLVVSSTGPYFSSGIDTAMFGGFAPAADGLDGARRARLTEPLARYEGISAMQRAFSALEQCRIPVIAAVQGGCIGAGLDLVSACCMRYASADAFFSIYEIHLGMPADLGTFPRLARYVPEGIVRELAYTGRRMAVVEARERGFVNEVFSSQAAMLAGVAQVAKEIAAKAPLALMGTKRLITYGRDHSTADTLDQVALWIGGLVSTDQVKEAASARAERREPEFASLPPRL